MAYGANVSIYINLFNSLVWSNCCRWRWR